MQRAWSVIQALLAVAGGVWALLQLYEFLTSAGPNLEATVQPVPFAAPSRDLRLSIDALTSANADRLSELRQLLEEGLTTVERGLGVESDLAGDLGWTINEVKLQATDLIRQLNGDLIYNLLELKNHFVATETEFARYRTAFFFEIMNTGDQVIEDVQMYVSGARAVSIGSLTYPGSPVKETGEDLPLGSIRQQSKVTGVVWSTTFVSDFEAGDGDLSDIFRVTYPHGVADLTVIHSVSPFFRWADRNWYFMVFAVSLMSLAWPIMAAKSGSQSLKVKSTLAKSDALDQDLK